MKNASIIALLLVLMLIIPAAYAPKGPQHNYAPKVSITVDPSQRDTLKFYIRGSDPDGDYPLKVRIEVDGVLVFYSEFDSSFARYIEYKSGSRGHDVLVRVEDSRGASFTRAFRVYVAGLIVGRHKPPVIRSPNIDIANGSFSIRFSLYSDYPPIDTTVRVNGQIVYKNTLGSGATLCFDDVSSRERTALTVYLTDKEGFWSLYLREFFVGYNEPPSLQVQYSIEGYALKLSIKASDPDDEQLRLQVFIDGEKVDERSIAVDEEVLLEYKLTHGEHNVSVLVIDSRGAKASWSAEVVANKAPKVLRFNVTQKLAELLVADDDEVLSVEIIVTGLGFNESFSGHVIANITGKIKLDLPYGEFDVVAIIMDPYGASTTVQKHVVFNQPEPPPEEDGEESNESGESSSEASESFASDRILYVLAIIAVLVAILYAIIREEHRVFSRCTAPSRALFRRSEELETRQKARTNLVRP